MPDKDERELMDHELFDTEDVTFDMRHSKTKNQVTLTLNGDKPISLFRYYFALKRHVEQIERGLDILPENDNDH